MGKETHHFYRGPRSQESKAMHNSMGRDEEDFARIGELIEHASGCVGVHQGMSEIHPDEYIIVCIPASFAHEHPNVTARWEIKHCTPTGRLGKVVWEDRT